MRNNLFICCLLFLTVLYLVVGQSNQQSALPANVIYPASYNSSVYAGGNDKGAGYPALNAVIAQAKHVISSAGDIYILTSMYDPIYKISKQSGLMDEFLQATFPTNSMAYDKNVNALYLLTVLTRQIIIRKIDIATGQESQIYRKTDPSYGSDGEFVTNDNGDLLLKTTNNAITKMYIFNTTTLALTHVFGNDIGNLGTNGCEDGSDALSCQLIVNTFTLTNDGKIVVYGTGYSGALNGIWTISGSKVTYKLNVYFDARSCIGLSNNEEVLFLTGNNLYNYNMRTNTLADLCSNVATASDKDGTLLSDYRITDSIRLAIDYSDNSVTFSLSYSIKKISPITNRIESIAGSGRETAIPFDGLSPKNLSIAATTFTISKNDEMYFGSSDANMLYKINSQEKSVVYSTLFEMKAFEVDKSLTNDVYYARSTEIQTRNDEFRYYRGSIAKLNEITKLNTIINSGNNILDNNTKNPIFGGAYVGLSTHQDDIYIADNFNNVIRKIQQGGNVVIVAGNGTAGFSGDGGLATEAMLNNPTHAIVDSNGNLWISDLNNNRVRKVSGINGIITTIAGNGMPSEDDFSQNLSPLFLAESISGDAIYVSDFGSNMIKKIDKLTNQVSTIAGTGSYYENNIDNVFPALEANMRPISLLVRSENSLDAIYFTDNANRRLRKFYNDTVSSIPTQDINRPWGLEFDPTNGDFYVSNDNYEIRKINSQGQYSLFAGNGTNGFFFNDGIKAVDAPIRPTLMVRKGRNLYFSNMDIPTGINNVKYISFDQVNATISTLTGGVGDGLSVEKANFGEIIYMETDEKGNLYILDGSSRIRKITKSTGIVSTIAGGGLSIENDIPATQAFFSAGSFSVLSENEMLIPDNANNRIFKVLNGIVSNIVGNYKRGTPDYNLPVNETSIMEVQSVFQTPYGEIIFGFFEDSNNGPRPFKIIKLNKNTGKLEELTSVNSLPYLTKLMRNTKGELFYTSSQYNGGLIYKLSPYCPVGKLNALKTHCVNECFGIVDETVGCSSRGYCIGQDQCSCFNGYNGTKCEDFTCNSILKSQSNVCSGHGVCSSFNNCTCSTGYSGNNCEEFDCFGVSKNSASVCSSNGQCTEFNKCNCKDGFYGASCDKFDCFGVNSANSSVCSSHGSCLKPNNCTCENGYFGNNCELFTCFGQLYSDNSVCSNGNGTCSSPNNCTCKNGYYGSQCESFNCKGIKSSDSTVCSSRGQCIAPDTCKCSVKNAFGLNCEFVTSPSVLTSKNIGSPSRSFRLNGTTSTTYSPLLLLLIVCLISFIMLM